MQVFRCSPKKVCKMNCANWYKILNENPPNGEEMNPSLGLGLYLARLKGRGIITLNEYLKIQDMLYRNEVQFIPGNE